MKSFITIITLLITVNSFALNKDAFSGAKFWYLDAADRAEVLTDLYKQTKSEYALWDFKKKRVGVDGDKLFNEYIAFEKTIADVANPVEQAKSNLDFYDRAKKLIASFQDTHFGLRTHVSMPWFVSGFETKLVNSKVIITSKYNKVVARTANQTGEKRINLISLGDEVTHIDGVSVQKHMDKIELYNDASSKGYARNSAGRFLLERYFLFPSRPFLDVTIKKENKEESLTVRLPLYYSGNTTRVRKRDARFYLKQMGYLELKDLRYTWNKEEMKWVKDTSLVSEGLVRQLPKGAVELQKWTSAKNGGSPIVYSAIILKDAKAYGYMQVNSFSVSTLYRGEKELSFPKAINLNVKYFKDQGLDLILDIRNNGGGRGSYPAALLSALTEQDKEYTNTTWATPVTRYMRHMVDYYGEEEIFKDLSGSQWEQEVDDFYAAINEGRRTTRSIIGTPIKADEFVGGYEGKIVALVSPSCISACDITSMLLKGSKRATIIGTHANGTGAGYRSNELLNTQFVDRYKVFSTRIPNVLFGYTPKNGEKVGDILSVESAYELNSENVPVKADIEYIETKADYKEFMSGWISKAIEVLNK